MDGQVSIEESLKGLTDANKEHRLRQMRARLMMQFKRATARLEVKPNHAKRALRTLAEEHGTTVKSLRRRPRYRAIYKNWKDIYDVA